MDVQEVIDLLIKLKGKEEIKETNQALEETAKDLEKVEKQADKTGEAMSEAAKVGKEFGSKLADALKQIATDSLDEETGLPSAEKAVKAVGTALDGLIDAAPLAATAIGGPLAGMIANQLTTSVKSLKDTVLEYVESLVKAETEEEAATRRQEEYAKSIGKTIEEVLALEEAEKDRKKRQEADAKKLEAVPEKEAEQKSKEAAAHVDEAVKNVGGKQAIEDVADAMFKVKASVQLKAESRGDAKPEDWEGLRKKFEEQARLEAASLLEIARGGRGTQEQQADAQKKLDLLMNNGQVPEFKQTPFAQEMQKPTKKEQEEIKKEAKVKEDDNRKADKAKADKAKADNKTDLKIVAMEFKEFMATLKDQGEAAKQEGKQKAVAKKQDDKEADDKKQEENRKNAERERVQRLNEQQAKETARERPDIAFQVQKALYENGNNAQAQMGVARQLEANGMQPDVAGAMVGQQSADLQNKFAIALNVTGNVDDANIAIQTQLQAQYEMLVQKTLDLQRRQMELQQRMQGFGPALQNQGR